VTYPPHQTRKPKAAPQTPQCAKAVETPHPLEGNIEATLAIFTAGDHMVMPLPHPRGQSICEPIASQAHAHRRRDAGGEVEETRTRAQDAAAPGRQGLMARGAPLIKRLWFRNNVPSTTGTCCCQNWEVAFTIWMCALHALHELLDT
jgi:hypothetical protein